MEAKPLSASAAQFATVFSEEGERAVTESKQPLGLAAMSFVESVTAADQDEVLEAPTTPSPDEPSAPCTT